MYFFVKKKDVHKLLDRNQIKLDASSTMTHSHEYRDSAMEEKEPKY